ncbi:MAG: DUF4190 domain-containing protein, partial [Coriobacteriales bacterium]|nr:DUF4190 domain-containing protein [Coriobacteriales bacterium]
FAIAALVLGVIGLFGCIFSWLDVLPTTLAIIFGGLGLKSSGRGMAIAGIILGVVGFILIGIVVLFVFDVIADPTKYGLPANYFDYLLGVFLRLS